MAERMGRKMTYKIGTVTSGNSAMECIGDQLSNLGLGDEKMRVNIQIIYNDWLKTRKNKGRVPDIESIRNISLVEEYERGEKIYKLLAKYEISNARLYQILKRYGVEKRKKFGGTK